MGYILVNYTGRKGGGAQCALEITRAFLENGQDVVAIISAGNESIELWKKLNLKKLIIIETYNSKKELICNTFKYPFHIAQQIKRELEGIDIELMYCPMVTLWSDMINRTVKYKRMIAVCHDPIRHSKDKTQYIDWMFGFNRVFRKADYIIVHSRRFVETAEKKYRKKGRVRYLPHGPFNSYNEEETVKIPYDGKTYNFLFFGTINEYKGIAVLGEAYKKLSEKRKEISLTVAGSGDFSKYKKLFDGLKNVRIYNRWIENNEVKGFFTGENVILVLPYLDSTQSGVIPIAYENGVPVIASRTGGLQEQVEENVTGIMFEAGNVDELADAMERMIMDYGKRQMFAANQKKYLEEVSWGASARKIADMK